MAPLWGRIVPVSELDSPAARDPSFRPYNVPSSGALIGRAVSCDIRLNCPFVSGEQCRIKWNRQGKCFGLEDLSSNGTLLNHRLVGKDRCVALADRDTIQLTKRSANGLVFHFRVFEEEPPDAATPAPRVAAVSPWTETAPKQKDTPAVPKTAVVFSMSTGVTPSFGCPAAAEAQRHATGGSDAAEVPEAEPKLLRLGTRSAQAMPPPPAPTEDGLQVQRFLAERRRAEEIAAELSQVKAELTHIQAGGADAQRRTRTLGAEALIALEDEAVREAERAQLMAQRNVLEGAVADASMRKTQMEEDLKCVEGQRRRECEERERLSNELEDLIHGHSQLSGQLQAFTLCVIENDESAQGNKAALDAVRSLTPGLEARLAAVRADVAEIGQEEEVVCQRVRKLETEYQELQRVARSLKDDICKHTSELAATIECCPPQRSAFQGSTSFVQRQDVLEVVCNGAGAPMPTIPHENEIEVGDAPAPGTGLPARRVLSDLAGKENMSPRSASVERDSGRRKRRRDGFPGEVLPANPEVVELTPDATVVTLAVPSGVSKRGRLGGRDGVDHLVTGASAPPRTVLVEDLCSSE